MGQSLSDVNSHIVDSINQNDVELDLDSIVSGNGKENINLFFSTKILTDGTINSICNSEKLLIKQIQNHLLTLTKANEYTQINININKSLRENGFISLVSSYQKACEEIQIIYNIQQKLKKLLRKKLGDEDDNQLMFAGSTTDPSVTENDGQQFSYFVIQMLTSLLLISIKVNEQIDPSISSQIINLASQFCQQIPIKTLYSFEQISNPSCLMFKSLKPLINYINQLSLSTDRTVAIQATQILFKIFIVQSSLKGLLPLISKLIFNTTDTYNLRHLFLQINDCLVEAGKQSQQLQQQLEKDIQDNTNATTDDLSFISLNYLKSNGIYPNTNLKELPETQFTGQFISSVLLSYIDIHNEIHSNKQFNDGTIHSSISFEFHPDTFKQLFHILEQLSTTTGENLTLNHILTVCIRLFKIHLKFLSNIKSEINQKLLKDIDENYTNIDVTMFANDFELQNWFDLLLIFACRDDTNNKSASVIVCQEASEALIYVMDLKSTSFTEKLSFIQKYILENKYSILIDRLFIELNTKETLLNWIHSLCDIKSDKHEILTILYSFIDIALNKTNNNHHERMKQVLESFQQFFLIHLVPQSSLKRLLNATPADNDIHEEEPSIDTVGSYSFAQYISYIFQNYINPIEKRTDTEFINQILVGLCFLTQTDIFSFNIVQPIFISVLPLLADYLLQCTPTEDNTMYPLYWLIGKMSHIMMIGSPQNFLEIKHIDKLNLSLFSGGCERTVIENNSYLRKLYESNFALYSNYQPSISNEQLSLSDHDFLMSIHNNINEGTQLISKLKPYIKSRQHILKSIEDYIDNSCAALFAVYIKHYRRINLARFELTRIDDKQPHQKLLLLYQYATHIQTLFISTKAQGGDCEQLYNQIKTKTLFLLSTVKNNNSIPIIQIINPSVEVNIRPRQGFVLQRQRSQWTKAKHVFTILRHTLHACIRFKKLILEKKQTIQQKQDYESILHKQIENFVMTARENKELDQITQCMIRQYERAITRLITYRFIHQFIENILKLEDKQQILMILTVVLPDLRRSDVHWYYIEHIQTVNDEFNEEIRKNYYSIIETLLNVPLKSNLFERNIFYLLNLSYTTADIRLLYEYQLIEILFKKYVSCIEQENHIDSFHTKLIGYNWFRLYVLTLCQNEQNEQDFIFNTLILNELKGLRQLKQTLQNDGNEDMIDSVECRNHSLNNSSIGWFLSAIITDQKLSLSTKFHIELCTNQWLILLLRCIHLYEHIRSLCATMDFIEELLYIYRNSRNRATIFLALKILCDLLPLLSESSTDNMSNSMMNNLFNEFLFTIGDGYTSLSIPSEIITQLIHIYRTIISQKSPWQLMAIQLVFDSISTSLNTIDWKSIDTIDQKQWNYLLASLYVLGGYIEPYSLGSIVNIRNDKDQNESDLGIIIDIDTHAGDQTTADTLSYLVQYLEEKNRTASVVIDKLEIKVDCPSINLLNLPITKDSYLAVHSLLDTLGNIIQIDKSINNSLRLLQLKRCCMITLFQILHHKSIIDIFIQKPYASFISHLADTNTFGDNHLQSMTDLYLSSRIHLEKYSFSLDRCQQWKEKLLNNSTDANDQIATGIQTNSVTSNKIMYTGWKPYATKEEIELYKKGRSGNDEISIIPFPRDIADMEVIQQCGNKHRFKGRIYLNYENRHGRFPTFILENLALTEGNWYYCVKLPYAGLVQIGWATTGFVPQSDEGSGIGDDKYSWSFDGSRGTLYNDQEFHFLSRNIRWKANDVCGCGIEINGQHIQIKYWLNGHFLGTPFVHQSNIASTAVKCNLLPNGPNTSFFPGVTLQAHDVSEAGCELIFSPEDMTRCPLPDGYKPILLPKLETSRDPLVAYPYNAYIVGDDVQDFIYTSRKNPSITYLRDFINENHIQTSPNIQDNQLRLTEDSDGFPFSIDDVTSSFTISFDFQILTQLEISDILLFTLQIIDQHPIQIPFTKTDQLTKTVLVIHPQQQQIEIYLNNNNIYQIVPNAFANQTMVPFMFHFLPKISANIKNFAIWKYELSKEHIQRLFHSGLSYVAIDYKQQNEYRLEASTFRFTKNQQYFPNEYLVPFNESFNETKWTQIQKQIDMDESKFFQPLPDTNESILQFYGNKTYLVIEKSAQEWLNYTIILDILIPKFPNDREQLALVLLNLEQHSSREPTHIFITSTGQICLHIRGNTNTSETKLKLNQFIRLVISVNKRMIKIYADGLVILSVNIDNDLLTLNRPRIHLFRELYADRNTTNDDTVRIECKSITFLNRSIGIVYMDEILKSPKYSLETLIVPTYLIHSSSLISIGYKAEWIKYVIEQYKTYHIQLIDTILREHKEEFLKMDIEKEKQNYSDIFSRLSSSIDKEKLDNLINISSADSNDQLASNCELILAHWNDLQRSESLTDNEPSEFNSSFVQWIYDQSTTNLQDPSEYQLFDLNQSEKEEQLLTTIKIFNQQTNMKTSISYLHQDLSYKQYIDNLITCEYRLISVYARDTIWNLWNIWSNTSSQRFPLENFGDYPSIIKLLRSINESMDCNSGRDPINNLIKPILNNELKTFIDHKTELNKSSLLHHLQKDVIVESIRYLLNISSSIDKSDKKTTIIEEQTRINETNLNFILKILNLFVELIKDNSTFKQQDESNNTFISAIFPELLINIMFDLFLIFPTYQSKIFILHLFITLIQSNINFHLNERIENFMSQLLIELLSNESEQTNQSIKSLQMILTDFVYVNLSREKSQFNSTKFELKFFELPQNFQNLWMVIDILHAITDPTKQTPYPELLFVQAYNLFDETLIFTLDDLTVSSFYFDQKSDRELINLMNNDALIEHSLNEFIHSLDPLYGSNTISFELYPTLIDIPANCIQTRAKLFHILESFTEKILSFVDLSFPPGKSLLVDKIRIIKNYLLTKKKMSWFEQILNATKTDQYRNHLSIQFDFVRANSTDHNEQNTTFYQGFEQLHENAHILFRTDTQRLWHANYIGMHSHDSGGPYRDSITSMCSDICSTRLSLFILCPNGRMNVGWNRDRWIPNVYPLNQPIPNKIKKQYQFIGQLMGMAIRRKHYLDFKFPNLLWKQLVGEQITIKDIEDIDTQSFSIIKEMENQSNQNDNDTNYLFSSVMSELRFDIVSSAGHIYELIPGGKDIPIIAENFKEYCKYYREYRLNEFHRQIEYIHQGLCSIVPKHLLSLLTANELEEAVCGKSEINIELLKRNTHYGNTNHDSPYIQRFWKVLNEMFNEEQKKLFLKFVWGRNTLPNRDEDFTEKFSISLLIRNEDEADRMLPRSYTCSFTLHLPTYSTAEIMYKQLSYSITHCESIDADG